MAVASPQAPCAPMNVRIMPATPALALLLAPTLRPEDVEEVRATLPGITMEQALLLGIDHSIESYAVFFGPDLACIWGVAAIHARDLSGGFVADIDPSVAACGWMLGSPVIDKHPKSFMLTCRAVLPQVLERYGSLTNWIDARYSKALRWAERLGFHLDPPKPHGPDGLAFRRFVVTKECLNV